jgi:hypothetical protein
MKQGYIIHSERGCVHTCSNCNERIELFYPDGTEVVTLPYCPYCGCSLGEKSETSIPFMTSPIGDLPINSEGLRKAIDKMVELSVNRDGWRNRAWDAEKELSQLKNKIVTKIFTELLDFVNGWFEGVENNDFVVEFNRILKDLVKKCGIEVD